MQAPLLEEDYRTLGLDAGCSLLEVERAYQKLRNLYDVESLATYALFDDDERKEKLDRLQGAYRRILREMGLRNAPPEPPQKETTPDAVTEQPPEELPCLEEQPGIYLRRLRERSGLSIRDVADRTKIGPFQLESIESERFDKLPAPVYLRGFVLEFARIVGANDPQAVAGVYLERLRTEARG